MKLSTLYEQRFWGIIIFLISSILVISNLHTTIGWWFLGLAIVFAIYDIIISIAIWIKENEQEKNTPESMLGKLETGKPEHLIQKNESGSEISSSNLSIDTSEGTAEESKQPLDSGQNSKKIRNIKKKIINENKK